MSYTDPTITASEQTFAELQAEGFRGYLDGLLAAQNGATAQQISLAEALTLKMQAQALVIRADNVIDSFLGGAYASINTIKSEIFDLQFAFLALATALGEIGDLVEANQGYSTIKTTPIGMPVTTRVWS